MPKLLLTALLGTALLLAAAVAAAAADAQAGAGKLIWLPIGQTAVEVNGVSLAIDVPAQIMNDRTMVPVRFISETVGATVSWNESERKVTIEERGLSVMMWIDKTEAMVNGETKTLDVAPVIQNGRTLVPLRFVSENLGRTVGWDNVDRGVYVVSGQVENVVLVKGFTFGTGTITARAGATVVFINLDTVPHTVSDRGGTVESGELKNTWAYTLKADQPGTYQLFCRFHARMAGTLTVQ